MTQPNAALAAERIMRRLGLEPDPWQLEVLRGQHSRLLLNCCRQAGKSTIVALHALLQALYTDDLLVLLLSRSHRQSAELFQTVTRFYQRIGSPLKVRLNAQELTLESHSRIISLPCKEETIRGYANVGLLIIDEASRVPDDLYKAVRPMLAVSRGSLICMSTPYGKRGFFYDAWANGGDDWHRFEIPAEKVPRIQAAFLEQERRCLGDSWFRQEYQCSFEALEGLVFPDLRKCVVPATPTKLPHIGGIDFGYRNPFAAIWGYIDHDDILWLIGEHYCRQRPLSYHAARLPRGVTWHADPAGAGERAELTCGGFTVRAGNNSLRPGIAAVNARIQQGSLKIVEGACPNLLAEAGLYRYSDDPREKNAEIPVDEHNHALAALRYLIAGIDARMMGRRPGRDNKPGPWVPWLRYGNEALWTKL